MKPLKHATSSASRFGGNLHDYLEIHNFMDSSKAAVADARHRAIFHSAFGIFVVEKVFGVYITNSDNKKVSVRDIAEQHVLEDLGFIPTLDRWFEEFKLQNWMERPAIKSTHHIPYENNLTKG